MLIVCVYQKKAVLLRRKIIPMTKCIYFITLILILAACQPQLSSTPFYEGQEVTLTASVSGSLLGDGKGEQLPSIQRITGKDSHPQSTTDGAINLSWSAGDQIVVRVGERSAIFDLISGEGTGLGSFRGTMPADGTEYHVSYPIAYHDSLLRHQNYVKDGFGNGLMKMSTKQAGTLDKGFELQADNALLGLQLTGDQSLGTIIVTNLSNDSIYTLHCDGVQLQTDAAMLFYLVVPVAGWSDGMRLEVYNEDGRIILRKEKADAMTFAAAEAIVMPALETVSSSKTYRYALTDQLFAAATSTWNMPNRGWAIADQSHIQGKTLAGIRMKVHQKGSIKLYTTKALIEPNPANLRYLTTITTDKIGLQDIDFDAPIHLGTDEYIVIGTINDPISLIGNFHATSTIQPFYNRLGRANGARYDHQSLMVDFY